jgi:ribosome-associated protein
MPAARTPERTKRHAKPNFEEKSAMPVDDEDYISKSELKREADEIHRLAQALTDLRASDYGKLQIDEDMRSYLDRARTTTAHIAKKREVLYIAKQLRKRRSELAGLFRAIDKPKSEQKKETARMHRLERWRERLLSEGDSALTEFVSQFPGCDRQELRSLIRAAIVAREREKNDGSYSAIYKMLGALDKQKTVQGEEQDDEQDDGQEDRQAQD